jgi:hypothetical protein
MKGNRLLHEYWTQLTMNHLRARSCQETAHLIVSNRHHQEACSFSQASRERIWVLAPSWQDRSSLETGHRVQSSSTRCSTGISPTARSCHHIAGKGLRRPSRGSHKRPTAAFRKQNGLIVENEILGEYLLGGVDFRKASIFHHRGKDVIEVFIIHVKVIRDDIRFDVFPPVVRYDESGSVLCPDCIDQRPQEATTRYPFDVGEEFIGLGSISITKEWKAPAFISRYPSLDARMVPVTFHDA